MGGSGRFLEFFLLFMFYYLVWCLFFYLIFNLNIRFGSMYSFGLLKGVVYMGRVKWWFNSFSMLDSTVVLVGEL